MKYIVFFIFIFTLACNSYNQNSESPININTENLSENSIYMTTHICNYMIANNTYPKSQEDLLKHFDDSLVKDEIQKFKLSMHTDSTQKFLKVALSNDRKNYYSIPFNYCDLQKRNYHRQHRFYYNEKEVFNEDIKERINEITIIKQETLEQLRKNTIINRLKTNEKQPLSFMTFKYETQHEKWIAELTQVEHNVNEVNEMSSNILFYLNEQQLSETVEFNKICVPLNFYRLDQYL